MKNSKTSIYVHMPFCLSRCHYCDFNTFVGIERMIPDYISALEKEIEFAGRDFGSFGTVHTIFFGGGTPSIVPSRCLEQAIESIKKSFQVEVCAELTFEANPMLLSESKLRTFKNLGFNRISIGMQSANDDELSVLGRRHKHIDTIAVVIGAKNAGFNNINLDLIYGFPTQTLASFKGSLQAALALTPTHISLYGLGLHEGTKMYQQIQNRSLPEPDDDLAADMYQEGMDIFARAGFDQYEISNWSKGMEYNSLHNLQYWRNDNYLGFGAGAHSHYLKQRWENYSDVREYIEKIQSESRSLPFASRINDLSLIDEIQETMIMGLRLVERGVSLKMFRDRFGKDIFELYGAEIKVFTEKGLLEIVGENESRRLRLTKQARIIGNQVFQAFIIDE